MNRLSAAEVAATTRRCGGGWCTGAVWRRGAAPWARATLRTTKAQPVRRAARTQAESSLPRMRPLQRGGGGGGVGGTRAPRRVFVAVWVLPGRRQTIVWFARGGRRRRIRGAAARPTQTIVWFARGGRAVARPTQHAAATIMMVCSRRPARTRSSRAPAGSRRRAPPRTAPRCPGGAAARPGCPGAPVGARSARPPVA